MKTPSSPFWQFGRNKKRTPIRFFDPYFLFIISIMLTIISGDFRTETKPLESNLKMNDGFDFDLKTNLSELDLEESTIVEFITDGIVECGQGTEYPFPSGYILEFNGYEQDTESCRTCYFYCINNNDVDPSISHFLFGAFECDDTCLDDLSITDDVGTWNIVNGELIKNYGDGTWAPGNDPSAGYCGIKYDESVEGTQNVFICVDGIHEPGTISGVVKAGQIVEEIEIPGPDNCDYTCDTEILIQCPENIDLSCIESTDPGDTGYATATGGCTQPIISYSDQTNQDNVSGNCDDFAYTLTRTWSAIDDCGNSAECQQTITVTDIEPPNINCPQDITVNCSVDDSNPYENFDLFTNDGGSADDNCALDEASFILWAVESDGLDCEGEIRTYQISDVCGNTNQCSQSVTIHDVIPPQVPESEQEVVSCIDEISVPTPPVVEGSCTGEVTQSGPEISEVPSPLDCEGSKVYTWSFSDCAGNTSNWSYTYIVEYTSPPEVPGDDAVIVECLEDVLEPIVPIVYDQCGNQLLAEGPQIIDNPNPLEVGGTRDYIYTFTDCAENSSLWTFTYQVLIQNAPVVPGDDIIILTCPQEATEPAPPEDVVDACGTTIEPTGPFIEEIVDPNQCIESIIYTYIYTDDSNNSSEWKTIYIIEYILESQIPPSESQELACASEIFEPEPPFVDDGCGVALVPTGPVITGGPITCEGTVVYTWTYTDCAENEANWSYTFTVNYEDGLETPPNESQSIECLEEATQPEPVLVVDNCGEIVEPTGPEMIDSPNPIVCEGTRTYVYSYEDCAGNTSQWSYIYEITRASTFTLPADVSELVTCVDEAVEPLPPIIMDVCGAEIYPTGPVIVDEPNQMSCEGQRSFTWTYEDCTGFAADWNYTYTIENNNIPVVPDNEEADVECIEEIVVPEPPLVQDFCGEIIQPSGPFITDEPDPINCTGTRIYEYEFTDCAGNTAFWSSSYSIEDNTAPTIEFVDPMLVGMESGDVLTIQCYGLDPEWDMPQGSLESVEVSDNCVAEVELEFEEILLAEGDCETNGFIQQFQCSWTATDACGNVASVYIIMELIDAIPPTIEGVPDDITVACDEIPEVATVEALDECNCAHLEYTSRVVQNGCLDGQILQRIWTATDHCGNLTVETQNITLVDKKAPSMSLYLPGYEEITNDIILEFECGDGGFPEFVNELNQESVNVIENCSYDVEMDFTQREYRPLNCEYEEFNTAMIYTWTASDACGNESSLNVEIRLIDNVPPVFYNVQPIICANDLEHYTVFALDDCNTAFWSHEDYNMGIADCGEEIMRVYTARDACGNEIQASQIIYVDDLEPPSIEMLHPLLKDLHEGDTISVSCSSIADGQISPFLSGDVIFTDPCIDQSGFVFAEEKIHNRDCDSGDDGDLVQVSWSAADICGNAANMTIYVNVKDMESPIFVDLEREIIVNCISEVSLPTIIDDCSSFEYEINDEILFGECSQRYTVERSITAQDECGNKAFQVQMIHVYDTIGPEILGVEEILCEQTDIPIIQAVDECSGEFFEVSMVDDTLSTECGEGFTIERTWSAQDDCGNISSLVQYISIEDQTPPDVVLTDQSILPFLNGEFVIYHSQISLMEIVDNIYEFSVLGLDHCSGLAVHPEYQMNVEFSENCAESSYYEKRNYEWSLVDLCGNETIVTIALTIIDDLPPEFTSYPEDLTVICEEDLPAPPELTAHDSSGEVEIEFEENTESGNSDYEINITRVWTATDVCGNQQTIIQNIVFIPKSDLDCLIDGPSSIECDSHDVEFNAQVTGGYGPYEYHWTVNDGDCIIQDGQGTSSISLYVGFTNSILKLTVIDSEGCETNCEFLIDCEDKSEVVLNSSNSLGQIEKSLKILTVTPVPTDSDVKLNLFNVGLKQADLVLFDKNGKSISKKSLALKEGLNEISVDLSTYNPGLYVLSVVSELGLNNTKVIKVK